MKHLIVFIILVYSCCDIAAAQEKKNDLYSLAHIRLAHGVDPIYGVSSIFGVETNKFRVGIGTGYEITKIKIEDKKRSYSILPIFLRYEIITEKLNSPNLCTELGCGVAWLKEYEARCGGYFGIGFSFVKGQLCIMYRRQLINIKNNSNILRHQAYVSFGVKV